MAYQEPTAEVIQSEKLDDALQTMLRVSKLPSTPLAPASLISLQDRPTGILDLHRLVKQDGNVVTFATYDSGATPLHPNSAYIFRCWWAPDQLALAQDNTRAWTKQTFEPRRLKNVRPDFIDHEHCSLCWQRISTAEGDQHEGFTDGKNWLCETCHLSYIASGFGSKLGGTG